MENTTTHIMKTIEADLNQYYGNAFIYPVPTWAVLHTMPELLYLLPIYGEEGIKIAKQQVNFTVDFSDYSSVVQYADFLFQQMDTAYEIIAYVVFYHQNLRIDKHPNYLQELTAQEQAEQQSFNDSQPKFNISVRFFNRDLGAIDDLLHWK
ncbi:hypothetical protein [Myroides fluvii]|uniref:hypothetical protein n=1 Tax=Myroides fluvii TaxID=2572594 RepID=UPI00131A7CE1|nr:hypothetical protein [Myroides fluvii]